jgi:hypothetical protein
MIDSKIAQDKAILEQAIADVYDDIRYSFSCSTLREYFTSLLQSDDRVIKFGVDVESLVFRNGLNIAKTDPFHFISFLEERLRPFGILYTAGCDESVSKDMGAIEVRLTPAEPLEACEIFEL